MHPTGKISYHYCFCQKKWGKKGDVTGGDGGGRPGGAALGARAVATAAGH